MKVQIMKLPILPFFFVVPRVLPSTQLRKYMLSLNAGYKVTHPQQVGLLCGFQFSALVMSAGKFVPFVITCI